MTPAQEIRSDLRLRAGELVVVKSKDEILGTLDAEGKLDGLPFMPEMLAYCGRTLRVDKRAHKTCDTIHKTGLRRMASAVHLEGVRCDGEAHGGCQAGCLTFWKEAWLRRPEPAGIQLHRERAPVPLPDPAQVDGQAIATAMTEAALHQTTRVHRADGDGGAGVEVFSCQATELFRATRPISWWDVRHYLEDIASGNVSLRDMAAGSAFAGFAWALRQGRGHRLLIRIHDAIQRFLGGRPYPVQQGQLESTPTRDLDLEPGDLVRVRPFQEIVMTLDKLNRNRGLSFDEYEMEPYCGSTGIVRTRVERIINERNGTMMVLPNGSVILEHGICSGRRSLRRMFCPRGIYSFWREIWLEPLRQSKGDVRATDRSGTEAERGAQGETRPTCSVGP